jgi:hypothetical protein
MRKLLVLLAAIILTGCTTQAKSQSRGSFPNCNEKVFDDLGGGVVCRGLADGTVITAWDPAKPPQEGGYQQCVCNNGDTAFTLACDPGSGENPNIIACFGKNKGPLPEGPVTVEFFRNPISCTTIGGTRTCKCIDNPFTPTVNECKN